MNFIWLANFSDYRGSARLISLEDIAY